MAAAEVEALVLSATALAPPTAVAVEAVDLASYDTLLQGAGVAP
jgi:hypothetical protein